MQEYYFTASARLGIWDTVNPLSDDLAHRLREVLSSHSHGCLEIHGPEPVETENPGLRALDAVLDKIVSRGNPTVSFLDFEERLLKSSAGRGLSYHDLKEKTNGRILGYSIDKLPPETSLEALIDDLTHLLALPPTTECATTAIHSKVDDSVGSIVSPEEDQFYGLFGDRFSPAVQSRLLRQQRISHLIGKDVEGLQDNRVDFAMSVADLPWIFEIDGEQHQDAATQNQDELRDEQLSSSGWRVYRIPAKRVREDIDAWFEEFTSDLPANEKRTLADMQDSSIEKSLIQHDRMFFPYELILFPHAVQKCVRALVELLRLDLLPIDKPSRILCIEEDLPIFHEALFQVLIHWENLRALNQDFPALPRIHLCVQGERPILGTPSLPYLSVEYVTKASGVFDLIVFNSACLYNQQEGHLESSIKDVVNGRLIRIRNLLSKRSYRRLQWSPRIHYDLNELENQLVQRDAEVFEGQAAFLCNTLRFFLKNIFRKNDFWDGQVRVITRLLQGKNTIVLLPTGGGKSLTYQFAGLLLPGLTMVIDPLIALMVDQVENIADYGVDQAAFLSSQLDAMGRSSVLEEMERGELFFVFISPERLQSEEYRTRLHNVVAKFPVSLAVLDEAHCVSEWGHDFRPSYLHLGKNILRYCGNEDGSPTLVGLTGTASFAVLADIQVEMGVNDEKAIVLPRSFDRKEITFHVEKASVPNKYSQLRLIKEKLPRIFRKNPHSFFELRADETNCGIIFCPHAKGQHGVRRVASEVSHSNFYAGGVPDGFKKTDTKSWNKYKLKLQEEFKDNQIQEIVATKAFGMGIDKPNIRYTIHYVIPHSVEAFYQEAGRAGRDGKKDSAHSFVVYSDDNWQYAQSVLSNPDHPAALSSVNAINRDDQGDLLIQLWLLLNTYRGRDVEKTEAYVFWQDELAPAVQNMVEGAINTVTVPFDYESRREVQEKSIYRLLLLGVVTDYSIDWRRQVFKVQTKRASPTEIVTHLLQYFTQYKFRDFAEDATKGVQQSTTGDTLRLALDKLIDFVYDEIVAKRKQALRTIAELCRGFVSDEQFRSAILSYLQESEFSPILKKWINKPFDEIGLDQVFDLLDKVIDLEEVKRLVGTTRRMLDEDPRNIALRFVSVCARARSRLESDSSVLEEARFLVLELQNQSNVLASNVDLAMAIIGEVEDQRPAIADSILQLLLRTLDNDDFVVKYLEDRHRWPPPESATMFLDRLLKRSLDQVRNTHFY
jgi:ATP-dependent DNA helicase RecQ